MILNLFYEELEDDRWIKFDRYPRRLLRRIFRGKPQPGGQMMVALNLLKGLDRLHLPYRFNDFAYIKKHPEELACIIGKPHLLFKRKWDNPILFGASVYSHAIEEPDLFQKYPNVKEILVPGEWMKRMFEPYYRDKVRAWPVGIDTNTWSPKLKNKELKIDFLIYDKIRWGHDLYEELLIIPIKDELKKRGLTYSYIKYGSYKPQDLISKLSDCKAVIFLCEHETQGLAYQQILSTDTPILAWDRGGYWQDPYYFPHKVKFGPVSSVPYWNETCGGKFKSTEDFRSQLSIFLDRIRSGFCQPRQYILDNLTLEKCANEFVRIANSISTC